MTSQKLHMYISKIVISVTCLWAIQVRASLNAKFNEFDWSLTKTVLNNKCVDCNVITSPFSVKLILSLLSNAVNPTSVSKHELSILYSGLKTDQLNKYWHDSIRKLGSSGLIAMASQICVNQFNNIDPVYQKTAINDYATVIRSLDPRNTQKSAREINKFVYDRTRNNIENFIQPNKLNGISVLLLNVLYFEARWSYPFNQAHTTKSTFYVAPGNTIQVPMMYLAKTEFDVAHSKSLNAKIIRIDYENFRYSMYIVLPNERYGLQNVINKLDAEKIESEISDMIGGNVNLRLPKFKFDSSLELKQNLKTVGIKNIFTSNAGIESLIRGRSLHITDVVQRSGIVVNEAGTIAYAASSVSGADKSSSTLNFTVDHPFLFFIQNEETRAILFAGKVMKPTF